MTNPAQEGIDAAKVESGERNLFDYQYDDFQDLLGNFEQQLDELIDLFQTQAAADYRPELSRIIHYHYKKLLTEKSDRMSWKITP